MTTDALLRDLFLFLAKNRTSNRLAKTYGLRFGASRFVAGEDVDTAIACVAAFNERQITVTLDHLGEFVTTASEAEVSTAECIMALQRIANRGVQSHLSLKLTQLGLDLSYDLCLQNMRKILAVAQSNRNFVRIDMEDYAHNAVTLAIFKQLRAEYGATVGLVLQAYLYKSERDLADLQVFQPNLRFVKGAYKEPASVAFPKKEDVDKNFLKLVKRHLESGNFAAIATHDESIIEEIKTFAETAKTPRAQFEFQMLYGIRSDLQEMLAQEGYQVRVYVPYGIDWYGYFMRRLAERPANVAFVLKSLLKAP